MSNPSVEALLILATSKLDQISATSRLDAELLMMKVLRTERVHLVTLADETLEPEVVRQFLSLVERRIKNEPIAYLTEKKEFWGIDFKVNSDCLIPRPETEHLIELAVKNIKLNQVDILELGTGSGCISIALATELEKKKIDYNIIALDKSESALEVAKFNHTEINPELKISFVKSDWFSEISNKFDIIISNPPYISLGDPDVYTGAAFEPFQALYSQDNGLSDLKFIINNSGKYLRKNGILLLEFGATQQESLDNFLNEKQLKYEFFNDLSGKPRNLVINFNNE